jgi:hypothetical protein
MKRVICVTLGGMYDITILSVLIIYRLVTFYLAIANNGKEFNSFAERILTAKGS